MTGTASARSVSAHPTAAARLPRGGVFWALFEGARDPFVPLVSVFVFMPYFATVMVGDAVRGQAVIAGFGQWTGWIVALTAPLLGTIVDRLGPRKPWLIGVVAIMAPAEMALWWALPNGGGIGVQGVVLAAAAATVCYAYTEVLHNAMLANAVPPSQTHRASGLGLTAGSLVSLTVLIFVLWAFALPGKLKLPFIPAQPLFGLDAAAHEPERIVALIAGVLLALGTLPLLLFTRDAPRTSVPLRSALTDGVQSLLALLGRLRRHRDVSRFLLARMFYFDGMTSILLFGGVYAAGVMQWGALQLLVYGVLLSVFSAAGGLIGGWLDGRFGPRRAVMIETASMVVSLALLLGISPTQLFYIWPVDPSAAALWNGPFFTTWPDIAYLVMGFFVAVFINSSYTSSRTLLLRLAPAGESGAFFGIYALSGTATMWLGAFLVHFATDRFGTQQAGMIAIAMLIAAGLVVMTTVRGGDTLSGMAEEALVPGLLEPGVI